MGAATLVVYLFHGFVDQGRRVRRLPGLGRRAAALSLPLTTIAAAALALLLAWPPVATGADPRGRPARHRGEARRDAVRLSEAPAQADEIAVAVEEAVAETAADAAAGQAAVTR